MKKTPLYDNHVKLGARIVEFGGWLMPVQYSGIIDEHVTTRTKIGLFDVSHMGEIEIKGPDAIPFIQKIATQDVSKAKLGEQVQYSVMCYPTGGVVDDILIYPLTPTHIFLCVNASNTDKDFEWIQSQKTKENVTIENTSAQYVQIAIQGPKALDLVSKFTSTDLSKIKYYRFTHGIVLDSQIIISRTGYTGEDGFELYAPSKLGPLLWDSLLEKGKIFGIKPCGLGARDTLRVEMRYPLYGHELSENITPLEADLEWVVKFSKPDFIGKRALVEQKEKGISQKCVGIEMQEPGIPRQDYSLYSMQNELIGRVSSGTLSPILNKGIGIAFVNTLEAQIGNELTVDIRGKKVKARVVETPFLESKRKK